MVRINVIFKHDVTISIILSMTFFLYMDHINDQSPTVGGAQDERSESISYNSPASAVRSAAGTERLLSFLMYFVAPR